MSRVFANGPGDLGFNLRSIHKNDAWCHLTQLYKVKINGIRAIQLIE